MAEIQVFDGVSLTSIGDTLLTLYTAPARLHRSRWAYDRADELARAQPEGVMGLMIVLPTADAPDAPTRMENRIRLRRLTGSLRRLVTVPVGDELRISIVRTIMRTMLWMQGQSRLMPVHDTLDGGVDCLLEVATPRSPGRQQVEAAIGELYRALQLDPPSLRRRATTTQRRAG
jgi:hypothetical protein